jgi:hypothetical protein
MNADKIKMLFLNQLGEEESGESCNTNKDGHIHHVNDINTDYI